jgi:hypothetical protein
MPQLYAVIKSMTKLILGLELNRAVYSDALPKIADTVGRLQWLESQGNGYAKDARILLLHRMTTTASFPFIVATFLLAPQGHFHITSCPRDSEYVLFLEAQAIKGLKDLSRTFKDSWPVQLVQLFKFYLWEMPTVNVSASDFWRHFPPYLPLYATVNLEQTERRRNGEFSLASGCTPTVSLALMGMRMAAFPATETCCERLFCQIRNLIGDFRQ